MTKSTFPFDVKPIRAENSPGCALKLEQPAQESRFSLQKRGFQGLKNTMAISKEEAVQKARRDLATRLGVSDKEIGGESVEDAEFPDTALGASTKDEMSGQMITPGWRIRLQANGHDFEYRANKNQVRLYNYKGSNYRV
jgi:hypothetical protein